MNALIVDDSRTTRMVLKRILRDVGFTELHEAADGQEALEKLAAIDAPQLALVDWNMPVMNGLELVKAVRSRPEYEGLRLMMVTTESEMEQILTALDAGANEYLMKPFNADDLRDKLRLLGIGAS
jgi:two-component system, chemotaxis family, chemotaxis protein CheY